MCLSQNCVIKDEGVSFHFSVDGENGKIKIKVYVKILHAN